MVPILIHFTALRHYVYSNLLQQQWKPNPRLNQPFGSQGLVTLPAQEPVNCSLRAARGEHCTASEWQGGQPLTFRPHNTLQSFRHSREASAALPLPNETCCPHPGFLHLLLVLALTETCFSKSCLLLKPLLTSLPRLPPF